jgi:hypothetical protein
LASVFPAIPPITINIRNTHPDKEKFAIGVYNAPTLHPFANLVPNPIVAPPSANSRTSLNVKINNPLNNFVFPKRKGSLKAPAKQNLEYLRTIPIAIPVT